MSLLANLVAADVLDPSRSEHGIFPATAELIWGTLASLIIFAALYKFALPAAKKGMAARTAKIQSELDASEADRTSAEAEAAEIRRAAGDIEAERARLLAEADAQSETLLAEGRVRLENEVAELQVRAEADIAAGQGRVTDELRAEISRYANEAVDRVLASGEVLDANAHNDLIESFIQKVGATS
jgi:F-type H+-transporting ATPase subunit b